VRVESARAVNDETHFIFVVSMLAIKLGQHDFQIGCLRADIDDIRRDISTAPLELFSHLGKT
jgi:hypothetical protein